jgi:hypothetical protein
MAARSRHRRDGHRKTCLCSGEDKARREDGHFPGDFLDRMARPFQQPRLHIRVRQRAAGSAAKRAVPNRSDNRVGERVVSTRPSSSESAGCLVLSLLRSTRHVSCSAQSHGASSFSFDPGNSSGTLCTCRCQTRRASCLCPDAARDSDASLDARTDGAAQARSSPHAARGVTDGRLLFQSGANSESRLRFELDDGFDWASPAPYQHVARSTVLLGILAAHLRACAFVPAHPIEFVSFRLAVGPAHRWASVVRTH